MRNQTHTAERVGDHPVIFLGAEDEIDSAVEDLRGSLRRCGFAVFTVADDTSGAAAVTTVARDLALGEPHIPAIYRNDPTSFGYDEYGLNTITVAAARGDHPFFGTHTAQGFHTDGATDPIGAIPTSVMWFERAAETGGHTTIFNAVEAFRSLASTEPELAVTLTTQDALTRHARAAHPPQSTTGPAFKEMSGTGLRARWAEDGTEEWNTTGEHGHDRALAVAALRDMSCAASPYRMELAMPSRTGLILRNDVVAHGRTAFDTDRGERVVIRGLFAVAAVA